MHVPNRFPRYQGPAAKPDRPRSVRTGRGRIGAAAVLLTVLAGLALLAAPARAQDNGDDLNDDIVVLVGDVVIGPGDSVGTVVVFDGSVEVAGLVRESLVVFSGDAVVSGTVRDSVVVFDGELVLRGTARVGGDVVTSDEPRIAPSAVVEGEVEEIDFKFSAFTFGWIWHLVQWLALTVSLLLLGIVIVWLFPRGVDASRTAGRREFGAAVGFGFLALIGLPIVAVILMATLVGLPFGLGLLFALGLIYAVGYVVAGILLGSFVMRKSTSRWAHMFIGLLILRGVALIPILDAIVAVLAIAYGLGVVVVAVWRGRPRPVVAGQPAPETAQSGPMPPAQYASGGEYQAQPATQQPPQQYGAPPQYPPQTQTQPPPPQYPPAAPPQAAPTAPTEQYAPPQQPQQTPPAQAPPAQEGGEPGGPPATAPGEAATGAPGAEESGPASPGTGGSEQADSGPGQDDKPES